MTGSLPDWNRAIGDDAMTARDLQPIEEPTAWKASDFTESRSWVLDLTGEMAEEIYTAAGRLAAAGVSFRDVVGDEVELGATKDLIAEAYTELNARRGFTVIAGMPVDDHGYEENLLAYSVVASQFGRVVVQNYEGDFVVDVIDKGVPYSHQSRGYSSNKLLPFHTDGADYAGLLCLGTAADGGMSLIASTAEVYNEVLRTRPGDLEVLQRGFYHHRRGQHDPGEPPLSPERVPVFTMHDGLLHCCYNRNPIDWAEKEGIELTGREVEALDNFDAILARPDMRLSMGLQKGDMQFINNYTVLHSRTEYMDDAAHKRHLVRLWLDDTDGLRNGYSLLDLYVPAASRFAAAP
jgi:alpha-ketoglutarate-dependent taurine dioxygenase